MFAAAQLGRRAPGTVQPAGHHGTPTPTPTPDAEADPDAALLQASATPRTPTLAPTEAAAPAPVLTPIPAGTVLAQGDVASPKGSIHFHFRVVADGDDTFTRSTPA